MITYPQRETIGLIVTLYVINPTTCLYAPVSKMRKWFLTKKCKSNVKTVDDFNLFSTGNYRKLCKLANFVKNMMFEL